MDLKKLISIAIIVILVANVALFAAFRYDELIFWGIIIVGFVISLIMRKKDKML